MQRSKSKVINRLEAVGVHYKDGYFQLADCVWHWKYVRDALQAGAGPLEIKGAMRQAIRKRNEEMEAKRNEEYEGERKRILEEPLS